VTSDARDFRRNILPLPVAEWLSCWTQASGNSLKQTAHTHRASVHQATNGSGPLKGCEGNCRPVGFMTHFTCRLTAKNRDQLRKPYAWYSSMGYLYLFYWPDRGQTDRVTAPTRSWLRRCLRLYHAVRLAITQLLTPHGRMDGLTDEHDRSH